jgi:hypothetical protein
MRTATKAIRLGIGTRCHSVQHADLQLITSVRISMSAVHGYMIG